MVFFILRCIYNGFEKLHPETKKNEPPNEWFVGT